MDREEKPTGGGKVTLDRAKTNLYVIRFKATTKAGGVIIRSSKTDQGVAEPLTSKIGRGMS